MKIKTIIQESIDTVRVLSADAVQKANSGREDEENNYYSLGGDHRIDLEEDKG